MIVMVNYWQNVCFSFKLYNTYIFIFTYTAKGYITVEVLRQILHEIDDKISPADLDLMIDEIDADGSGTVDFEGTLKYTYFLFYSLLNCSVLWFVCLKRKI